VGGAHGCLRCVGASAPSLESQCNLTVVGSRAKKGQKSYLTQLLYMTAMLTCYLLWVPRRGVPRQCFCHGCPRGGGLPVCPCAYMLSYSNLVD
jgi:hypothetical protein